MSRKRTQSVIALLLLAFIAPASRADDETTRGYGHVRTLEGSGVLTRGDDGESDDLLRNYPLQVGDWVETDRASAAELVLADANIVRIGETSEVGFPELANSADSEDERSLLVLERGELQLVVTEYALGDELPMVVTPLATVRVYEPGSYLVEVDEVGRVRLIVRSGYAEISTASSSAVLAAGEEIGGVGIEGRELTVVPASAEGPLERWGAELSLAAASTAPGEVDPALGYSASALEGAGEWVESEGARAWRPRVAAGWRPFSAGVWVSTSAGLSWVGFQPWSWVTAHYGQWVLDPYWGWIWLPGRLYSPAHVYWYWGSGWVGWVPTGYYGRHGWRGHFYGYAGGSWTYYRDWTFCPTEWIGRRRGHRHHYSGRAMPRVSGRPAVPRGVVSTETSGLTPFEWRDGPGAARELIGRGDRVARRRDLTGFIAGRDESPGRPVSRRPPSVAWPDDSAGGRGVVPRAGDRHGATDGERPWWRRGIDEPAAGVEGRDEGRRRSTRSEAPVRRLIDRMREAREREGDRSSARGEGRSEDGARAEDRRRAHDRARDRARDGAPGRDRVKPSDEGRRRESSPRATSGESARKRSDAADGRTGGRKGGRSDTSRRRPKQRKRPDG